MPTSSVKMLPEEKLNYNPKNATQAQKMKRSAEEEHVKTFGKVTRGWTLFLMVKKHFY